MIRSRKEKSFSDSTRSWHFWWFLESRSIRKCEKFLWSRRFARFGIENFRKNQRFCPFSRITRRKESDNIIDTNMRWIQWVSTTNSVMYINYVISLCSEFNVVSTYIKFRQSDIEELPVYIGQKWPSESLELTCWADDDSLNIEIIGSMVGAVRRKYQVFVFYGAILKY